MGTPHFALGVLTHLIETGYTVVGVITAPDKPAGRGRKIRASAVKEYAVSKGLPVLQPKNLKDPYFLKALAALEPELQVVVAFRMLPEVVWAMPSQGTFNLHASLLPQYRGAAPINWAIINGETETGVTTFFIDEKIDTGALILQETVAMDERETFETLHDKLLDTGKVLVAKTIDGISQGTLTSTPQQVNTTLKPAPKLRPENTRIQWEAPAHTIDALARGLSPFPTAWTTLEHQDELLKVKIYSGRFLTEDHEHTSGTIIASKNELKIATKDGWYFVEELQLPGKRKMDVKSLLNGFSFEQDAKMS